MLPAAMRHSLRPILLLAALLALPVAIATAQAQTTPAPTQESAEPTTRTVSLTARLRIRPSGTAFVGTGRVTGRPFGTGRARLRSTIRSRSPLRTSSTLTVTYESGTVVFRGTGRYVGSTFTSTMRVIRGTGAYRDIRGSNLRVTSRNRGGVDTLRLRGRVRYTDESADGLRG